MAIVDGYATRDQLRERLDNQPDASADALLDQLVTAASRQIDGFTARFFGQSTATRTFTAEWSDLLIVDDLVSVTTLATDNDGDRTYETSWAVTDYDLNPDDANAQDKPYTNLAVAPNGNNAFPLTRRGVQLAGVFGWPAVPAAITEACLLLAVRLFVRKSAPFGIAGSLDGQVQTIPGLDPDVKQLVWPYRRLDLVGV